MVKITFIGAGSLVFGKNVLTDLLFFPSLQEDTILCLEDIHAERLDLMFRYIKKFKEDYFDDKDITIEKTTKQRKAIEDAKYVIDSIHVGGLDAFKLDVEIPFKYGVSQTVGDTIGPGGVFRFLRAVNSLKSILEDIEEVGHNAKNDGIKTLLLNYANPMAMNTWFCNSILPDSTIGLCHGVQGTAELLRNWAGLKREEFSYFCAGINHMAWFLELWYKDSVDPDANWQDAYPLIYKALEEDPMKGVSEKVRIDMMKASFYNLCYMFDHMNVYGPPFSPQVISKASATRVFASDMVVNIVNKGAELLGSMAISEDFPYEKLLRDAKITQLWLGGQQICRYRVARGYYDLKNWA